MSETSMDRAVRLLGDAHAAAEAGDVENALLDAQAAVEALIAELEEGSSS
jgi:HEPN domain-containing protein